MSSKRSAVNPSECKSVAKKSRISVTLVKKIEVIQRTGDGGTCPNMRKVKVKGKALP